MTGPVDTTFAELHDTLANAPAAPPEASISVVALAARWLAAGPQVLTGGDREALDALCRQIDVRKRISIAYDEGWRRRDDETPAPPEVAAAVVAVLLANAAGVGETAVDGAINDGWGLKCTNSALKALDQPVATGEIWSRHEGTLRAIALGVLDRIHAVTTP